MTKASSEDTGLPELPVLNNQGDLELQAWVRLLRVRDRVGRRLDRVFAARGLSCAQFDVIATLSHRDGITQQELSALLLVTKGNITGLIDRAEVAGWVERRPDPVDRRVNRLYLTDGGRRRLVETLPDHRAVVHQAFGRLGSDRVEALFKLLDEIDRDLLRSETS